MPAATWAGAALVVEVSLDLCFRTKDLDMSVRDPCLTSAVFWGFLLHVQLSMRVLLLRLTTTLPCCT